jgi:hypothetical protein
MTEPKRYYQGDEVLHLTVDQLKEITKTAVTEAVTEVIKDHPAVCPIPKEAWPEVPHIIGVVKGLGGNNVGLGAEEMRQNHLWTKKVRERLDRVSNKITNWLIVAVLSGILILLGLGVKGYMKQ